MTIVQLLPADSGGATTTTAAAVAELVVDGATTSLAIPSGLLSAGQTYVAELVARSSPGAAGAVQASVGVPFGEAAVWTATFTTTP